LDRIFEKRPSKSQSLTAYFSLYRKVSFSNKTFEANFLDSAHNITAAGLKSLKKGLQRLASLKNISLYVLKHEKLSDFGLESLRKGLQKLPNLQHLSLRLPCSESLNHDGFLTNNALKYLTKGIQKITSLQSLALDFSL